MQVPKEMDRFPTTIKKKGEWYRPTLERRGPS